MIIIVLWSEIWIHVFFENKITIDRFLIKKKMTRPKILNTHYSHICRTRCYKCNELCYTETDDCDEWREEHNLICDGNTFQQHFIENIR